MVPYCILDSPDCTETLEDRQNLIVEKIVWWRRQYSIVPQLAGSMTLPPQPGFFLCVFASCWNLGKLVRCIFVLKLFFSENKNHVAFRIKKVNTGPVLRILPFVGIQ